MGRHDYYISDLHLSAATPRLNDHFDALLKLVADDARSLTIVGDFLNAYAGFRQLGFAFERGLFARLRALADAGLEIHFVAGNRDFLLARDAPRFGITGHADGVLRTVCDEQVYATHGDQFCLDDVAYLRYRAWVRRVPWQALNFVTPPAVGRWVVGMMRRKSIRNHQKHADRPRTYYDIKDEAALPAMEAQGATVMVCGHIHQPQTRLYPADGAGQARRMLVLGDWRADGAVIARGSDDHPVALMAFDGTALAPWQHTPKEAGTP